MTNRNQPGFIRESLLRMQTGFLHCPDDHLFNLQSVKADIIDVDENGLLWLAVNKPPECADGDTLPFDIVLNCYSTDVSFDLDLLGEARLVTEKEELNRLLPGKKGKYRTSKLLLQIEVIDIDYYKHKTPIFKSIAQKIQTAFSGTHAGDAEQEQYADQSLSA